ncbi:choice-of-anchor P family protein [Nocardioides ferulae]|uniref:choice-of-anchor P family protein n=1 Tax=Nocardioides ferulae TaxID=2340821 RepID=UPI000EAD0835|nr:choice-of-anchor P family protein [Nocardioides ferulae]
MRRISRVTAAFAAAMTTLALAAPAGAATASPGTGERQSPGAERAGATALPSPTAQRPRPSRFALKSWGYGTKISGGQVPAESGSTALAVISCTNETGLRKQEGIATVELPGGIVSVNAADTNVWTERKGKEVHSYSTSRVAGVTLFESSLGKLSISAFSSLSHVWHDGDKFRAETKTSPAGLTFTDPNGQVTEFELPLEGAPPLEIPGLAKVELGHEVSKARRDSARAYANALKITVIPSDTVVTLAHSSVSINDGITNGLLGGHAYGIGADVLNGVVKVGRTPKKILPCRGTDGTESAKSLVGLGQVGSALNGVLEVGALTATVNGKQTAKKTWGWTRAELTDINLGDGQFILRGLKVQANVSRNRAGKVVANAKGTTFGEIVVGGETQSLPDPGAPPLEIPGLAKIEFNVVEKPRRNMVIVTGLRVTLLEAAGDAAGVVLNIAQARAKIDRSGL